MRCINNSDLRHNLSQFKYRECDNLQQEDHELLFDFLRGATNLKRFVLNSSEFGPESTRNLLEAILSSPSLIILEEIDMNGSVDFS